MPEECESKNLPRIAMYCRYFPPDVSGAGIQALSLGKKLASRGHQILIVTDNTSNASPKEIIDGITVYRIPELENETSKLAIVSYWLRLLRTFFAHRKDFDVLHAHGVAFESSFIVVVAKVLNKPIMMKTTLAGEFKASGRLSVRLQHFFLRFVDLFIAISRDLLAEHESVKQLAGTKIVLVPNGVDLELYRPLGMSDKQKMRDRLGLPARPVLVFHGVFMERKGISWLVESITDFLSEQRLVLLLIGDPCRDEGSTGYYSDLLAQTSDFVKSGSVIFTSFQKNVKIYLQACDAYILPSSEEGLSNSLLEAMAVGLVPMSCKTSGAKELLIHKQNGLVFGQGRADELRRAIGWYLSISGTDEEKAIQAAARKTIEKNYSLDKVADRYSALYRQLVHRH